jgi:hypothetical protein
MNYINIINFPYDVYKAESQDIFVDHNTNGPYDNLFLNLRHYYFYDELPEKYILNINTLHFNTEQVKSLSETIKSSPRILEDLKSGNAKILINRIAEEDSIIDGTIEKYEPRYKCLFQVLDELNVNKSNILFLSMNCLADEAIDFNKSDIDVRYHNFTQMNLYSIIKDKEDLYREEFEKCKTLLRKYYYLCYNNQPSEHRKVIVDFLLNKKVKGLLSSTEHNIFLDSNPPTKIESWSQNNLNLYYYVNQDHYRDSYFSIVTESHYSDSVNSLYMGFSEKIWKPIVNFHPFLLVGARNSLSKLREFGFETFPELFDESYDESDDVERLNDITNGLDRTFLMSIDELSNIYYSVEEKLIHNFHHFFRLCENETKEFERYLLNFCYK